MCGFQRASPCSKDAPATTTKLNTSSSDLALLLGPEEPSRSFESKQLDSGEKVRIPGGHLNCRSRILFEPLDDPRPPQYKTLHEQSQQDITVRPRHLQT